MDRYEMWRDRSLILIVDLVLLTTLAASSPIPSKEEVASKIVLSPTEGTLKPPPKILAPVTQKQGQISLTDFPTMNLGDEDSDNQIAQQQLKRNKRWNKCIRINVFGLRFWKGHCGRRSGYRNYGYYWR